MVWRHETYFYKLRHDHSLWKCSFMYGNKLKVAIEWLKNIETDTWKRHVVTQPKLRTYGMYKHDLCTEEYVKMNLTRTTRSFIAQFRIGILPLHIETGRFVDIQPEDRICFICNMKPETEINFMFKCPLHMHLRNHWLQKVINLYPSFSTFPIELKLQLVLSDRRLIINSGNFIRQSFMISTNKMYVNHF